jgi:pimeloyl-ACP methyl ester carboxylesterase
MEEAEHAAPLVAVGTAVLGVTERLAATFPLSRVPGGLDAPELSAAVQRLGLGRYCLVAHSDDVAAAVCCAVAAGEALEALVLLAPTPSSGPGGPDDPGLEQLRTPTLLAVGTADDRGAVASRGYARRLPSAYLALVHGAGRHVDTDRPEVVAELMADFLSRRERFVTPTAGTTPHR